MSTVQPASSGRSNSPNDWPALYADLAEADRTTALAPADLERLGIAAYLTGRDTESIETLARAHQQFLQLGQPARAARAAFWIAFVLTGRGERAPAGGWTARARRIVDDAGTDCVERGYLLMPMGLQQVTEGNLRAAEATFADAAAIGVRFGDSDLINFARHAQGRALVALGSVADGLGLMDEVMAAVTAGEVSPAITGTIYCSVISACADRFDVRRAQEWTDALNDWCLSQRGLVPYRGYCFAHRAELLVLHGAWTAAVDEARRASEWFAQATGGAAAGAAHYHIADVHRLRGEFAEAEEAYQRASDGGRAPQPGLALLRLAQGRRDAAHAAICRVEREARDPRVRSRVLPACVDIMLAAADVPGARKAADELAGIARTIATPFIRATSARATGAVLLAQRDAAGALAALNDACETWRDLDAPYETARTRELIGLACHALGDTEGAEAALRSARRVFAQLGAAPDLARIDARLAARGDSEPSPLTDRELDVLRLVAHGKTNRAIADELGISEKTVARHMSNIFTKLDLPSRSAATAYAFRHRLV